MRLASRHLLGIETLTAQEIGLILDTADSFAEISKREIKKVPTLRGKTVVNLFMEPSTRTRTSFELAEKRLSADSLNFSASGSSLTKGETLIDTARNIEAMAPDFIVMRHSWRERLTSWQSTATPPSSTRRGRGASAPPTPSSVSSCRADGMSSFCPARLRCAPSWRATS